MKVRTRIFIRSLRFNSGPSTREGIVLDVGFFRQLEAIDLSYRSYFHCPVSLDYMKSNWDKNSHTSKGVDEEVMKKIRSAKTRERKRTRMMLFLMIIILFCLYFN